MARGSWAKATWPACAIVNSIPFREGDALQPQDLDPYSLFEKVERPKEPVMKYNPAILQALQDRQGGEVLNGLW